MSLQITIIFVYSFTQRCLQVWDIRAHHQWGVLIIFCFLSVIV